MLIAMETKSLAPPSRNGQFAANTGGLSSDACPFTCDTGFKKVGRTCPKPDKGKYVNNTGQETSCSMALPMDNSQSTQVA